MTGTEMEGEAGFMFFPLRGDRREMLGVGQQGPRSVAPLTGICAEPVLLKATASSAFADPVCSLAAAFSGAF